VDGQKVAQMLADGADETDVKRKNHRRKRMSPMTQMFLNHQRHQFNQPTSAINFLILTNIISVIS